jgi:hypothetical protein
MKIKLRKPKRAIWNAAAILFAIGLVATYLPLPILSAFAFYLIVTSAVLMLLGTWIF